jgi:sugar phosphate permease
MTSIVISGEHIKGIMGMGKKQNFAYGWSLVFYSAILFMLGAGLAVDGLNVIVPAFSKKMGWDYNLLLSYSSIGGIIGFFGTIVFAQLVVKKGVKFMTVLTLFISGIATIFYGYSNSVMMYIVMLCILSFAINGYGFIGPTTIIANWFPRKKGIALGVATIGLPLATALFVPILAMLFNAFGHSKGLAIIGIATIILAIVSIFWVQNTPEEVGLAPDGEEMSAAEIESCRNELQSHITEWTVKRLLQKGNVWKISIGYGLLFLIAVGIVSQLVPRLTSLGYDQTKALSLLVVCAIVSIPGSYFWGLLDQKISTKKASILMSIWNMIALILFILGKYNFLLLIISTTMLGFGGGGLGNLQPSMVAQVFGRFDYAAANRVVIPIISIIRILAFAVVGISIMIIGTFEGAYTVFIGINIIALILIYKIDDKLIGKN